VGRRKGGGRREGGKGKILGSDFFSEQRRKTVSEKKIENLCG
jgi:hypothetical protein